MLAEIVPFNAFAPVSAAAQVFGDADKDGKVTAADARLVLRTSVGLEETPADLTLLDVDADGKITAADARLVLRFAVGLETTFPAAEKQTQPEEEPVQADPAGYPPLVYTNFKGDTDQLKNNAGETHYMQCSPSLRVQCVSTFHWNFGRGAMPGRIWIREVAADKIYGPWETTGRRFNGVDNAIWDVFLDDFDWKANTAYEVLDSDPATRSYTDGVGDPIFELRGWRDWPAVAPMLKKQGGFSGGKAGPASGKISYEQLSVDFGKTFDGDAVLMDDRSGVSHDDPAFKVYDLLLTGDSINSISVSLDAAQPKKNEAYQMQVGIPVKDGEKEGTLWFDLDTEWKNGRATAEIYPAFTYDQIDDVNFRGNNSLTSAMYDVGTKVFDLSMLPLDLLNDGVNATVDFMDKSIKMCRIVLKRVRLYYSGDFMLAVPTSLNAVTDKGAQYLLDDLNGILKKYRAEFDIHRDKWPMTVNVGFMCPPLEGGDAFFTMPMLSLGGRIGRNQVGINNSYMKIDKELLSYNDYRFMGTKYDEGSAFLYSTVAHELFHFVQRNYVSQGRTSLWVDESSATYMATEMQSGIGIEKYHDQNYVAESRMQFDMLRKTFSFPKRDGMDPAYISPVLFDFLTQIDSHALRKIYETLRDGSMFSSWATVLEKALHTTMRKLTIQYYCYLNGAKVFARNYEGWYIAQKALDPNDHDLDDFVEVVDLAEWQKKGSGAHTFTVGPYGVHFIVFKKSAGIGAKDFIKIGHFSDNIAIEPWIPHQEYKKTQWSTGEWEHFYNSVVALDTQDNYIVCAFVNGSGNNYGGGWFGSKASFDYEYMTDKAYYSTWPAYEGIDLTYPSGNSTLAADTFKVAAMTRDEKNGKYTKLTIETRGKAAAAVSISGSTLSLTLTDENGKTLYSGKLTYDQKNGSAKNNDCTLQFAPLIQSATGIRADRLWVNVYRADGGMISATCTATS